MGVKRPTGAVASDVSQLVREREQLTGRLAEVDRELAGVRRALGLAPDQEHRTCEVCQADFLVTRHDQRLCAGCREASPSRSVESIKDRATGTGLVEIGCHGIGKGDDLIECQKTVTKPNNRRGPLRCPDCTLGQKRYNTRVSLKQTRESKRARLERIVAAPPPRDNEPESIAQEPTPSPDQSPETRPEFESVWHGGEGLTSVGGQRGQRPDGET